MHKPCHHCQQKPGHRARGLCHGCYHNPVIRSLYPISKSVHMSRGTGQKSARGMASMKGRPTDKSGVPLPAEPTDAIPGSEEKIKILTERARLGLAIHHPGDLNSVQHRLVREEQLRRELVYGVKKDNAPLSLYDAINEKQPYLHDD